MEKERPSELLKGEQIDAPICTCTQIDTTDFEISRTEGVPQKFLKFW